MASGLGRAIFKGIIDVGNLAANITGSVLNAQAQQKALDQQKAELETSQKNIADANARQDKAEGNAINTATNALNEVEKQEQDQSQQGALSQPSLSDSSLPLGRV